MVNTQRAGGFFEQTSFVDLGQQVRHRAGDALGEAIHILRFDSHPDLAVLDSDEEIPEFAFGEGANDLVPLRLLVQPVPEIGNHSPGECADSG